jgi:hypothetical protein
MDEFLAALDEALEGDTFAQLVLSKPSTRGVDQPDKVTARPVRIRGDTRIG